MYKAEVQSQQNWYDIAIQYTGNVNNARHIAIANNASLTDTINAGSIVIIPYNLILNNKVLNYYTSHDIKPATAIRKTTIKAHIGIDNDIIGVDPFVSFSASLPSFYDNYLTTEIL